ncbi:uncharacterized protein LOC141620592 [Silene latifolia]|uniref:uncharacterized protein LOC141620592 n=1 Tax=Silene latifolia TaxID=37657 RepID=UPI003D76FDB1
MPADSAVVSNPYALYDDPLYLVLTDQPNQKLTEKAFSGINFVSWKRKAYLVLFFKNTKGFLDETYKIPPFNDPKHHQWVRCDVLIRRWISNYLIPEIKETVEFASTAQELWSELIERYGRTNSIEIYQMRKELKEERKCELFLIEKLKQFYETVDTLVEANAYASSRHVDGGHSQWKKPKLEQETEVKTCSYCKAEGHIYENCNNRKICFHCGKRGHSVDFCFELRGLHNAKYNGGRRGGYGGKGGYASRAADTHFINGRNVYKRTANNPEMTNVSSTSGNSVTAEEFSPLDFKDAPSVIISPFTSSSVSQNTNLGQFDDQMLDGLAGFIYHRIMGKINDTSTTSAVKFTGIIPQSHTFAVNSFTCMNSWIVDTRASDHMTPYEHLLVNVHNLFRLVHIFLPDGTVKIVHRAGTIKINEYISLQSVLIVPDFKQNLLSIGNLVDKTPLLVTFTKTLYQVHGLIKDFMNMINTQFGAFVKVIKTDHGTEFVQHICGTMFRDKGILHQKSILGRPQQNGRVERKHKHLVETSRSLRFHAHLL